MGFGSLASGVWHTDSVEVFLLGIWKSVLASQCLSQFCTLQFAKHHPAKGRIPGIPKVGTNYFQEKGDEWIHGIETDFPRFIVLKTFQGSDESSGGKNNLFDKQALNYLDKMKRNVIFTFLQLKLLETI